MARTVQEIVNRELLAVRPDLPAREARDLLRTFGVGAAPVLDEERRPIGVISLKDLLEPDGLTRERMSTPAVCVGASASVEQAARQLAREDRHHLVVVDGVGVAIGMLSTLDALRALVGMPTRHPAAFPHWDDSTSTSWTDDWLLDEESREHAPQGAGVLVLVTAHLGERDAVIWAESCENVRERVVDIVSRPAHQEPALARVLCLRDLRFRAAVLTAEHARLRVVALLRERIDRTPPPGAT